MRNIFATVLPILSLGFILGLQHALDGDHVAAVTSLVSKHKNLKSASIVGLSWGLGHTLTLLITGLILLLFKLSIPENIAIFLEFLVGALIAYLGISVIYELINDAKKNKHNVKIHPRIHAHGHKHGGEFHVHTHSHNDCNSHNHYHKSFGVGIIHGLAGSASIMLLVLSTVSSITTGLFYILIFGIGSMIGMGIVSGLISIPFIYTSNKGIILNKRIRYITGMFSLLFGSYIMFNIGYTTKLFGFLMMMV